MNVKTAYDVGDRVRYRNISAEVVRVDVTFRAGVHGPIVTTLYTLHLHESVAVLDKFGEVVTYQDVQASESEFYLD